MAVKTKTEAMDRQVLYPILQNGRLGFINNAGKIVAEPQFTAGAISMHGLREGLDISNLVSYCPKRHHHSPLGWICAGGGVETSISRRTLD